MPYVVIRVVGYLSRVTSAGSALQPLRSYSMTNLIFSASTNAKVPTLIALRLSIDSRLY